MLQLLFFHGNNGCKNAPQYYVVRLACVVAIEVGYVTDCPLLNGHYYMI